MNVVTGYDYDDLMLVPQPSNIDSRSEVDLTVKLDNLTMQIPIFCSPMRGIASTDLIVALEKFGGVGIQHRFYDCYVDREEDTTRLMVKNVRFGVAVGLNDDYYKFALDSGACIICVDIANGYIDALKEFCIEIADYIVENNYQALLLAGNVVTQEGAKGLARAGVNLIRVGIGSGALCTTRRETGVGYPQLSAIENCVIDGAHVIADGGINNSGKAVKALAMGSSAVMIGTLFSKCKEADHNGIISGSSSARIQGITNKPVKSIEGIDLAIDKTTTVKEFLETFTWGMKSGLSYVGAHSIAELQNKAQWVTV